MIGKQLKILLYSDKLDVKEFALLVKIKARTVYSWTNEADEKDPRYETLLQIKQKYREKTGKNINLDWLISGEGDMFITDEKSSKDEDFDQKVELKVTEILDRYGLTDQIK